MNVINNLATTKSNNLLEKDYIKYFILLCKIEGIDVKNIEEARKSIESIHKFSSISDMCEKLERMINKLSEKEQLVIRMRFGIGYEQTYTLAAIGRKLNLNLERIRMICIEVLQKFKTPSYYQELKPVKIQTIKDLELSTRAYNGIRRARIQTLSELIGVVKNNPSRLMRTRNLGKKSIQEILDKVEKLQLER